MEVVEKQMSKASRLFSTESYRHYIETRLSTSHPTRGARSRLAEAVGCQKTYLSQVIQGDRHITMDQAYRMGEFWELSPIEFKFWMTLVARDRSGDHRHQIYLESQLHSLKKNWLTIGKRISSDGELTDQEKATYYSHWAYAATHVAVSSHHFNTIEKIAARLNLNAEFIAKICRELILMKLIKEDEKNTLSPGSGSIHLSSKSIPAFSQFKTWRSFAENKFLEKDESDVHYTSVFPIRSSEFDELKDDILNLIVKKRSRIEAASSEDDLCYCLIDFGRV